MSRKSDEELFDGEVMEEDSEEKPSNVYKRPKAYRDLTEAQYNRCILREKMVAYCQNGDKHTAVQFVRDNIKKFKSYGYSENDRQDMHRSFYVGGYGNLTSEDIRTLNDVFGLRKASRPTPQNTQYSESRSSIRRNLPRTPMEHVIYLKSSTFAYFRAWMKENSEYLMDNMDDSLRDELQDLIQIQIYEGHTLPFQHGYTPEEDDAWIEDIQRRAGIIA